MNNELQNHKKSDTVKWILTLIAFILVGIILLGIILGWFEKKESTKEAQSTAEQTGGMCVDVNKGNGIKMLSAVVPLADYEAYGISPQAESAVTLTATVKPDNTAENTGVDWTIKWKNVSSSWATGKTVTDYVTITPSGEGYAESKTVTLTNLQPFGEQIIVTATARDNPEVTANCRVEYVQKITDFALSFGTVRCNFDGRTNVTVELNERGTPTGGRANFTPQSSSAYTIATETIVEYKLSIEGMYDEENTPHAKYWLTRTGDAYGVFSYAQFFSYMEEENYDSLSYDTILNYSVADKGLYFGVSYMVQNMGLTFSGGGMGSFPTTSKNYTPAGVIEMIEGPQQIEGNSIHYTNEAFDMFTLTVTVKSEKDGVNYGTLTKSTNFYMSDYTNTSPINAMEVSNATVVF